MATVYILYSPDRDMHYIGSCKDLAIRLQQHREKFYKNSFTSTGTWELFHSIEDLSYRQAREIESHIKRMKSRIYLSNLKKYPEIAEKLKEKYKEVW